MASILLAVCLLLAFVAPAEGADQLPPGFVHTRVVFLVGPVGIAFAPDGALWIAQGAGAEGMGVCVYRGGVLTQALSLPNTQVGDRGIHAIAVDPDYLQNGWIWIYYTVADPPRNRLSHFTNVGDTLQNEVVVVEGPPTSSAFHNGGCLAFASDRTLYLGMGDDSQGSTTAQDRFDLRGKILHINRDGTPAWDNPYANASGGDPRVWAWGLRNPYRCSVQPETDNLFIGDVGESQWEEIDMGVAGGNFGWASVEGAAPGGVPGFVYPIHRYLHDHASGSSVIAGKHVPSGVFDSSYEGNYFFADWSRSEIHRLVLDASHNVVSAETWANVANGPTDLAFGPDGALYYAAEAGAGVFRISYVGGSNHQPGAVATAGPQGGPAPLVVRFDGSGSSDADGDPLVYSWDFGDGSQMPSGPSVLTHSYGQGVFQARLTVDDGRGLLGTSAPMRVVSGNRAPIALVLWPTNHSTYVAGQQISYSGVGGDTEELVIPCSGRSWQVLLHHAGHVHPFVGPLQGLCSGSFTTADRGESSADAWYEIRLTVSDTGVPIGSHAALSGTRSVGIFPATSWITLRTAPRPDLALTLDTVPFTPPAVVRGVVNFVREIGAVNVQFRDGHIYRFVSWSDGGAREHSVRTPASDTTYLATFGCNVVDEVRQLRVGKSAEGSPSLRITWEPLDDPCLHGGGQRYRIYAAATPVPSQGSGVFPTDPTFRLVGISAKGGFTYVPASGDRFFLVVAVGSDGMVGPAGHYDSPEVVPTGSRLVAP